MRVRFLVRVPFPPPTSARNASASRIADSDSFVAGRFSNFFIPWGRARASSQITSRSGQQGHERSRACPATAARRFEVDAKGRRAYGFAQKWSSSRKFRFNQVFPVNERRGKHYRAKLQFSPAGSGSWSRGFCQRRLRQHQSEDSVLLLLLNPCGLLVKSRG